MENNYCIGCIHYNDGKHEIDCEFCDPPFEDRYAPMYNDHDIECEDDQDGEDETYNADRG